MPNSGSNDWFIPGFNPNPQTETLIDKLVEEYKDEYLDGELLEPMKKAAKIKFREIVAETVIENERRGNYIRIFPGKNSKIYEKYLNG